MPVDQDRMEVERINNLIRNFDWIKVKEEITDSDIILTIKKARSVPIPELGEGAD